MNGATLRTYRELLGYELNRYADKLGVNRRTVTRWERLRFIGLLEKSS